MNEHFTEHSLRVLAALVAAHGLTANKGLVGADRARDLADDALAVSDRLVEQLIKRGSVSPQTPAPGRVGAGS